VFLNHPLRSHWKAVKSVSGVTIHLGSPQLRSPTLVSRVCDHCKNSLIGTLGFRDEVFTPLQQASTQVVMPLNEFRMLCMLAVMTRRLVLVVCRVCVSGHIGPYWICRVLRIIANPSGIYFPPGLPICFHTSTIIDLPKEEYR
jgi:hypothetical protein